MHPKKDSTREKLLSNYVLARVTDLKGIDLNLFDFDRHNTLYYFILNAKQEIYLRYGGRDALSSNTYLNEESFDLALELGLERHRNQPATKPPRPVPLFPRQIDGLNREIVQTNRCVECHLVADYQSLEIEKSGKLNKPRDLFVSPDLKKLGIHLDVPKGLIIKNSTGAAAAAGVKLGDLITKLNGVDVLTFADLQHQLNKVDRGELTVTLVIKRDHQSKPLTIKLPGEWWVSDLTHRHWTLDPQLYFDAIPLTNEEKIQLKLPAEGFASKITYSDIQAMIHESHELEKGDIIISVNGTRSNPLTKNVSTHLKLMLSPGEKATLEIIRNGKTIKAPIKTGKLSFRK